MQLYIIIGWYIEIEIYKHTKTYYYIYISFDPYHNPVRLALLHPFGTCGNGSTRSMRDLTKLSGYFVTKPILEQCLSVSKASNFIFQCWQVWLVPWPWLYPWEQQAEAHSALPGMLGPKAWVSVSPSYSLAWDLTFMFSPIRWEGAHPHSCCEGQMRMIYLMASLKHRG